LLSPPSNRAVDVAVMEFLKHCEGIKYLEDLIGNRRILRFGYPRVADVMDRPELLGPANLDNLSQAARDLSRRIRTAERSNASEDKIATMPAEILTVQEELRNTVHTHIRQSAVVFTTSTLAYLGSDINPISDMAWTSVLVDEATMVPPAQCAFLATLANQRFLMGGDPRQLGPIYESQFGSPNTLEWMGKDIFEKSGISNGQGEARTINLFDSRLTRIDAQRRCCKEIWNRVRSLYPNVINSVNENSLRRLIDLPPKPGQSVILLDTSTLAGQGIAKCERAHGSWRNVASAELAMEVACAAIGDADSDVSIAIISPYRAQVRLLRNWIRQEARSENPAYRCIEAGTVHQFQGSDADFVIFDVVDGFGRPSLGTLLRDDTGLRLTTVAITRARAKVVIIADRTWYQNAAKREHNPLLWDLIVGAGADHMFVNPSAPDASLEQHCESPIERALRERCANTRCFMML
jgi:AAA domain-containing protein